MAKLPATSKLIYNPSSAAPGFKIRNVLCLPGVPSILKSMIENTKRLLQKGQKPIAKQSMFSLWKAISQKLYQLPKANLRTMYQLVVIPFLDLVE